MHRIMDGNANIAPIMYHFNNYRRCDQMLVWLIRNRLIGETFLSWMRINHKNSPFLTAAFVLSKVKKEKNVQPVLADKDFLINPGSG
jgi:hypothetical protein